MSQRGGLLRSIGISILLGVCIILFGCSKASKPVKEKEDVVEIDEEANLVIGLDEVRETDVALLSNNHDLENTYIQPFIYEPLFIRDESFKLQPHLASWETEDHLTYTFTLEEGIEWHDGTELTMEDWQFALELLGSVEAEHKYSHFVDGISGIEAFRSGLISELVGFTLIDDYQAEITFRTPRMDQLELLWLYPLPKHLLEDVSLSELLEDGASQENLIGTGPYKVDDLQDGEVVLANHDTYWQGKPQLLTVTFKELHTEEAHHALEDGELDLIPVRHEAVAGLADLDDISLHEADSLRIAYIGFLENEYVNEKYEDQALREAMYLSLNRDAIIDEFLSGKAMKASTVLPASFWIHADDEDLQAFEYDVDRANELLDEAGFKDITDDGFRESPTGEPFTIQFVHYDGDGMKERAEKILSSWEAVGLKTELVTGDVVDFETYESLLNGSSDAGQAEVFFGTLGQATIDPSINWHSSSSYNITNVHDEKIDQLLEKALFDIKEEDDQKETYLAWQEEMAKQLPVLPLWEQSVLHAHSKKLKDLKFIGNQPIDVYQWHKVK